MSKYCELNIKRGFKMDWFKKKIKKYNTKFFLRLLIIINTEKLILNVDISHLHYAIKAI